MLAGPEDSAMGPLLAAHTLFGTKLEDHPIHSLQVQAQLVLQGMQLGERDVVDVTQAP